MRTPSIQVRTLLAAMAGVSAILAVDPVAAMRATPSGIAAPQPYLETIRRPSALPSLHRVKVAIVDAGVDGRHPDLAGQIAAARPFGGGNPLYPSTPHATAVAGLIGAIDDNGQGIDGI